MPERRETPRLKTVLKMLGRAGGLRDSDVGESREGDAWSRWHSD